MCLQEDGIRQIQVEEQVACPVIDYTCQTTGTVGRRSIRVMTLDGRNFVRRIDGTGPGAPASMMTPEARCLFEIPFRCSVAGFQESCAHEIGLAG
jgi:hypothetical protein